MKYDDICFLQFTSGSTSNPKGVMVTYGSVLHNIHEAVGCFGFHSSFDDPTTDIWCPDFDDWKLYDDFFFRRDRINRNIRGHGIRSMSWLPVYHDMGLIGFVIAPIFFGMEMFQLSPMDFVAHPSIWMRSLSNFKISATAAPNFAYDLVVRRTSDAELTQIDLSHVCCMLTGAEPVRANTIKKFIQKFSQSGLREESVCPAFGLAENTLFVCGRQNPLDKVTLLSVNTDKLRLTGEVEECDTAASQVLVGCGIPRLRTIVRIVDAITHQELPNSVRGEVWIQSLSNAAGYFGRPELTEECFRAKCRLLSGEMCPNNHLRTGDNGFIHKGSVYLNGRVKDVIIIRGRNYYPQDIEEIIDTVAEKVVDIRRGCSAAFSFDVDGVEKLGVACEIKRGNNKGLMGWGFGWLHMLTGGSKNDDNIFEDTCKEINRAIGGKMGLSLYRLWLLSPRNLLKTSSGKIRRNDNKISLLNKNMKVIILIIYFIYITYIHVYI
eukprot:GHVR01155417.1.p1 GENE.GHVR01155417.1~~GHVR01155417.1.p1  ORF type:complete len:522 (-),score=123.55 GHVR01155417.1:246-1721(-)